MGAKVSTETTTTYHIHVTAQRVNTTHTVDQYTHDRHRIDAEEYSMYTLDIRENSEIDALTKTITRLTALLGTVPPEAEGI